MKRGQLLGIAALLGFLYACAEKRKKEPVPKPAPAPLLPFWVHDTELLPVVRAAADRIERASGIHLELNIPGKINQSIPIFSTDDLCALGKGGFWVNMGSAGFLMVSRNCTDGDLLLNVITHELFHALGAAHLKAPAEGLMRDTLHRSDTGKITAADLELLCSVRECTVFQPET